MKSLTFTTPRTRKNTSVEEAGKKTFRLLKKHGGAHGEPTPSEDVKGSL